MAKVGLVFDGSGVYPSTRVRAELDILLVDENSDFTVLRTRLTDRRIGALKPGYCVLLLQPFVEALADFEGDPLSDEALEWRKQFTVFVPYVARGGRQGTAPRPGQFMVRPDLEAESERKNRAARATARRTPLPPSGEDGL